MSNGQAADEQPIRYVLFVCNHNAGRSQMAQAFFERYGPEDVRAGSAGNKPAAEIWPTVIEAMGEIGIDLSGRKPKKLKVGRACSFSGARIRSHVLALAYRQARDCLRRETCDLIAAGETL